MGTGSLTLDWDAIEGTGPALNALAAARPALAAWVRGGGELLVETSGPGEAVQTALAPLPVRVAGRPAPVPGTAADSAVVEPGAILGGGSRVWRFAHVRPGAVVGPDCNVGQGGYLDAGAVVGARCKLQNGVNVYRGVVLGDGVFVGPAATFTNDLRPRAEGNWAVTTTLVGTGASIGANATIVCGNEIGPHAMVGAGAVVTKPVPPYGLVAGVPARLIGRVCACGERAGVERDGRWFCSRCLTVGEAGSPAQARPGADSANGEGV
ncbi:MAG TPA: acyltransferase [Symbiobacteriaceae bacterium]|jgi:acetyltransferase-like isoleucine patch superfamily enzyme